MDMKDRNQGENLGRSESRLKSEISKESSDRFSKKGHLILKWTPYHCANPTCTLQCQYNLFKATGKI